MRLGKGKLLAILALSALLGTEASAAGVPWNPFSAGGSVFLGIKSAIEERLSGIEEKAGRPVSGYSIKDWTSYFDFLKAAYKPLSAYKTQDTGYNGTPCGGRDGDPFWTEDCSCFCSRGGKAGVNYTGASDRCPSDDNLACEDCKAIDGADNSHTTYASCGNHI